MYLIIGADGQQYGPVSADQMRQWIGEGRINAQTMAAAQGESQWKPVGSFPEFAGLLSGAAGVGSAPNQYGAPQYSTPKQSANGLAIAGMSLGIASLVFICCCIYLSPLLALAGTILSGISLAQIRKDPSKSGKGMAITGLITSLVALVFAILYFIFIGFVLLGSGSGSGKNIFDSLD